MVPIIIKGGKHIDARGVLDFNNDFDAAAVKRIYLIENSHTDIVRAWIGHKIQQRWFSAIKGRFEIRLVAIDNWDNPAKKSTQIQFTLHSKNLDVLCIPSGYVCSIQSIEEGSKLLVMANTVLGELEDEYRYEPDYFE